MEINFTASQKFYMTCVKRPISFFGALIGLILLSPIFITTVILLHFANKGAGVFFTQNRPGKNEKIFKENDRHFSVCGDGSRYCTADLFKRTSGSIYKIK